MNKVAELRGVVGLVCTCNQSPTLRARLVKAETGYCTLEVTPTMYNRAQWANTHQGRQFKLPTETVYNMYFSYNLYFS